MFWVFQNLGVAKGVRQEKRVKSLKALSDRLLELYYLRKPDFKIVQKKDKMTKQSEKVRYKIKERICPEVFRHLLFCRHTAIITMNPNESIRVIWDLHGRGLKRER
jgi:hypothetical protein